MKAMFTATLVAVTLFAGSAQATPWTLTTQGTIDSGWDYAGLFVQPGQQLSGLKYTQTITAETDAAVYQGWMDDPGHVFNDHWSEVYGYVYGGGKPVVFSTVITINGKTLKFDLTSGLMGVQAIANGATGNDPANPNNSLDSEVQGNTADGRFVDSLFKISSDDPAALVIPAPDFSLQLAGKVPADSSQQQSSSFVLDDPAYDPLVTFYGTPESFSLNGGTAPADVPEPASLALLGLGLAGLGAARRRRGA